MSTTSQLIAKHQDIYKKATEHQFTKELCQGTLSDKRLFVYLTQDLNFFEVGLRLICKITSLAPDTHSLITLAKKIGFFANDENTYFHDCLTLLKGNLSDEDIIKHGDKMQSLPGIKPYVGFLKEMTDSTIFTYAQLITYLWIWEDIYLKWAHDLPRNENLHWKYQTWIDLHDGEHFIEWVSFLKEEVDKFSVDEVEDIFVKIVKYEYDFFESCYNA